MDPGKKKFYISLAIVFGLLIPVKKYFDHQVEKYNRIAWSKGLETGTLVDSYCNKKPLCESYKGASNTCGGAEKIEECVSGLIGKPLYNYCSSNNATEIIPESDVPSVVTCGFFSIRGKK